MSKVTERADEATEKNGCPESDSPVSPYRVRTCLPFQQPGNVCAQRKP